MQAQGRVDVDQHQMSLNYVAGDDTYAPAGTEREVMFQVIAHFQRAKYECWTAEDLSSRQQDFLERDFINGRCGGDKLEALGFRMQWYIRALMWEQANSRSYALTQLETEVLNR
jgi:hypothetical protein